jgi:hypothetical protein
VAHAARGSHTQSLCEYALYLGKPLWTVASKYNEHLVAMGARPVCAETVSDLQDLSGAPVSGGGNADDQYRLPLPSSYPGSETKETSKVHRSWK